jgi:hypothetical protein
VYLGASGTTARRGLGLYLFKLSLKMFLNLFF